jgi:hypothetical protein
MALDLATMNQWLQSHKLHSIEFGSWAPEEYWADASGFPLPQAAGLPREVLSLRCNNCHTGIKIAEAS